MLGSSKRDFNFDPYAGRKLYAYLFDLGYEAIVVSVGAHHVIYGELRHVMPLTG